MPPTSPVSPQTPHTPSPLVLPSLSRMPSASSTGTTPMLPVPPPMPSARLNAPRPPMPRLVSDPARPPPPYQRVDTPDPFDDTVPVRAPAPLLPHSSLQSEQVLSQQCEDEPDRGPDIDRHPDFWFIDGSAVLLCGRIGFRVHAGVLRMHCAAFRELLPVRLPSQASTRVSSPRSAATSNAASRFRLGHTARTQSKAEMMMEVLAAAGSPPRQTRREEPEEETIEQCPVLHLSDAADDVVLFLRALYDRTFLQDKRTSSLFTIGAVLALARAYGAHSLQTELSRYLRAIYPSSLNAYTALYNQSREHDTPFSFSSLQLPRDAHPLLALEIAARARLPAITPTALLRAARVPLSEVFDGFALDDGRRVRAGQDTVRRVIEFREKLSMLVEDALRRSALELRTCEACGSISAENVRVFEAIVREKGLEAGVVQSVRSMREEGRVCKQCADVVEEWEEGVRSRIWRGVPVVSGEAGGWDAIERAADD